MLQMGIDDNDFAVSVILNTVQKTTSWNKLFNLIDEAYLVFSEFVWMTSDKSVNFKDKKVQRFSFYETIGLNYLFNSEFVVQRYQIESHCTNRYRYSHLQLMMALWLSFNIFRPYPLYEVSMTCASQGRLLVYTLFSLPALSSWDL